MQPVEPSAETWRKAFALFEHFMTLDPAERGRELAMLAATNAQLYSQVLTLLGASRPSDVTAIPGGRRATDIHPMSDAPAAQVRFGPYRLEKQIGIGGMGEVWLARRSDGRFDGLVALKVLHAHIAQSSARERFVREGKILGQLSHPNIARLLDAGSTPLGVSYLVLEYVEEGVPIDQWCDERKLDITARLQLFLQICAAVSHAHAHLVIHRDLKPPNILVTAHGEIKLLDFGIAKLLENEESAGETELTRMGGRAMTLDFAAPEQILGLPVTTATDVYSLGVLLYLLLCGNLPHQRRQRNPHELEKELIDSRPPTLSRALSNAEELALIADRRATTPHKLKRALAGDLDTIVRKTLRVEPDRRYKSVEQLADDINRFLTARPVTAVRDTWTYRTRKFVSRHAVGAAIASVASVLLAGFVLAMYLQMQRTDLERARAERVSSFLVELFEQSDPYKTRSNEVTARELLDKGAARITESLGEHPETLAALTGTMGQIYSRLGVPEHAIPLLEQARRAHETRHGASNAEAATIANELGVALLDIGRLDEAKHALERALAIRTKVVGAESPEVAETLVDLGTLAFEAGEHASAEKYFRDSLALYSKLDHSSSTQAANAMLELANLMSHLGRYQESIGLLRNALKIDRVALGEDHPRVIMEMHSLAYALQMERDYAAAAPLFEESNERIRRTLGPDHPYTIDMLSNYARFLRRRGELEAAEPIFREVIGSNIRTRGASHPDVGTAQANLAILLHDAGRLDEAKQAYESAIETYSKSLPPEHPSFISVYAGLGRVLIDESRVKEGLPMLERAVDIGQETMTPESPSLAMARVSLASALVQLHEYDKADALLKGSYEIVLRTQGEESAVVRHARRARAAIREARAAPLEHSASG
jgi:serine/threonine protein kinase/tetratricopeptide (TPR) repeat protein